MFFIRIRDYLSFQIGGELLLQRICPLIPVGDVQDIVEKKIRIMSVCLLVRTIQERVYQTMNSVTATVKYQK